MKRHQLDFILCHFPLLAAPAVIAAASFRVESRFPVLHIILSILFGGGWLAALIYGFIRLSKQTLPTKRTILWVIGLLWFSVIVLPCLYWKLLRNHENTSQSA